MWPIASDSWADRDAIWSVDLGSPKEPYVRWGPGSPYGKGHFWEVMPNSRYTPFCHGAVSSDVALCCRYCSTLSLLRLILLFEVTSWHGSMHDVQVRSMSLPLSGRLTWWLRSGWVIRWMLDTVSRKLAIMWPVQPRHILVWRRQLRQMRAVCATFCVTVLADVCPRSFDAVGWVAVASAGPYASHLHLTKDR